jgi:hypothetical protein
MFLSLVCLTGAVGRVREMFVKPISPMSVPIAAIWSLKFIVERA